MRFRVTLVLVVSLFASTSRGQANHRLLIAFASYRERPMHAKVYFYEHDGIADGKMAGSIEAVSLRQDTHPALTADGALCAFNLELENNSGRIGLWSMAEKKLLEPPVLNDSPNAQMGASVSGDGQWVALTAWNRPGGNPRWDVFLYDMAAKKLVDLPGVNSLAFDERMPAVCDGGRRLAYATNASTGRGRTDVWLFDREAGKIDQLSEMNSPALEVDPWLSADGTLLAFSSDRAEGQGGRDVYLYDLKSRSFLPLQGLNSVAHEQSPALSPDGRFIVFVSERVAGVGERDIYLYDRVAGKLLPTPNLNAKQEDLDPCVVVKVRSVARRFVVQHGGS